MPQLMPTATHRLAKLYALRCHGDPAAAWRAACNAGSSIRRRLGRAAAYAGTTPALLAAELLSLGLLDACPQCERPGASPRARGDDRLCPDCRDLVADPPPPAGGLDPLPCPFPPGHPGRVEAMARRFAAGLELNHPQDATHEQQQNRTAAAG